MECNLKRAQDPTEINRINGNHMWARDPNEIIDW